MFPPLLHAPTFSPSFFLPMWLQRLDEFSLFLIFNFRPVAGFPRFRWQIYCDCCFFCCCSARTAIVEIIIFDYDRTEALLPRTQTVNFNFHKTALACKLINASSLTCRRVSSLSLDITWITRGSLLSRLVILISFALFAIGLQLWFNWRTFNWRIFMRL